MSANLYLVSGHSCVATRSAGLWVFIGVVAMLFSLFGAAYVMRMALPDWRPLAYVPWQLWLSTGLLAAASAAWHRATRHGGGARRAYALACLCSLAFLASQLWAWRTAGYVLQATPANSFFYLLTGLHGLHLIGGLVAAAVARSKEAIRLCARYWHFLFGLWLAVFGLLFWVTPEFVRDVCGFSGF